MKDLNKELENINKILYDECFGVWILNETKDNLLILEKLNWNYLYQTADKEKVVDKEVVFDRVLAIEKELWKRRGIR